MKKNPKPRANLPPQVLLLFTPRFEVTYSPAQYYRFHTHLHAPGRKPTFACINTKKKHLLEASCCIMFGMIFLAFTSFDLSNKSHRKKKKC